MAGGHEGHRYALRTGSLLDHHHLPIEDRIRSAKLLPFLQPIEVGGKGTEELVVTLRALVDEVEGSSVGDRGDVAEWGALSDQRAYILGLNVRTEDALEASLGCLIVEIIEVLVDLHQDMTAPFVVVESLVEVLDHLLLASLDIETTQGKSLLGTVDDLHGVARATRSPTGEPVTDELALCLLNLRRLHVLYFLAPASFAIGTDGLGPRGDL